MLRGGEEAKTLTAKSVAKGQPPCGGTGNPCIHIDLLVSNAVVLRYVINGGVELEKAVVLHNPTTKIAPLVRVP